MSKLLGVAPSSVAILRGASGRDKLLRVEGTTRLAVLEKLAGTKVHR